MKTLLAIRHVPFEDLGSFAPLLSQAGYGIRYAEAPTADFTSLGQERWDLVVVLGGPIGADDAPDYPFLTPETKFVEARLKGGAPMLAICLGSQLVASALGARVSRTKEVEIGWKPLHLTDAGRRSPLRHLTAPAFHWHGDMFELPAGAESLASTDLTPCQAFSWGRTLAMQFHPEVNAKGLESWYVGNVGELRDLKLGPGEMRRAAAAHGAAMEAEAALMLQEWLGSLA